jgi:hypothetical protein
MRNVRQARACDRITPKIGCGLNELADVIGAAAAAPARQAA